MSKEVYTFDEFGDVLCNGRHRYFRFDFYDGSSEVSNLDDMYHDWFVDVDFHKQDFDEFIESCLAYENFHEITEEEYKREVAKYD